MYHIRKCRTRIPGEAEERFSQSKESNGPISGSRSNACTNTYIKSVRGTLPLYSRCTQVCKTESPAASIPSQMIVFESPGVCWDRNSHTFRNMLFSQNHVFTIKRESRNNKKHHPVFGVFICWTRNSKTAEFLFQRKGCICACSR